MLQIIIINAKNINSRVKSITKMQKSIEDSILFKDSNYSVELQSQILEGLDSSQISVDPETRHKQNLSNLYWSRVVSL